MARFIIVYSSTVIVGSIAIAFLARTPIDAFLLGLPLGLAAVMFGLAAKR